MADSETVPSFYATNIIADTGEIPVIKTTSFPFLCPDMCNEQMTDLKSPHIIMPNPSPGSKDMNLASSNSHNMQKLNDFEEFFCGWGSAFVNVSLTFPINKVMFRQQLAGIRVHRAIKELHSEGLRHLYRGLLPPLLQKTATNSIMFGSYYKVQHQLKEHQPDLWMPANRTIAALLSGTLETFLCPFERIQVLMQDKQYQTQFNNTADAFKKLRSYGITEYYRGLTAVLLRNGPSNVPFFLCRDYMMENLPKADSNAARISQDFLCGALLGACLSTIFYPLNVVKVRMQCKIGGEFNGVVKTFRKVWVDRDRSVRKLFRGVHVNYTRSFISWGIINATYELLLNKVFGKTTRLAES